MWAAHVVAAFIITRIEPGKKRRTVIIAARPQGPMEILYHGETIQNAENASFCESRLQPSPTPQTDNE
jgi:hypothetical protein